MLNIRTIEGIEVPVLKRTLAANLCDCPEWIASVVWEIYFEACLEASN